MVAHDITERKQAEANQALLAEVLQVLNRPGSLRLLLGDALRAIQRATGFDAVGLRLREGDDYPYFEHNGFSDEFICQENFLCVLDNAGAIVSDDVGRALLECTCGLVVSGHTDPSMSCFTSGGSFWTNRSTDLLDLAAEDDPRTSPRNRCIHVGFQSVGLFPVRAGEEIVGLLQLNDRREGRFSPELLRFYESLAQNIGLALQRASAEEALRASEEGARFLADVVEQADVPFGVGSPDGRLILFNQAFADLTGYSRKELEAKELTWSTDLTPPQWREAEAQALAQATDERHAVRYEKEYRRKDGSRLPIELFVQPVFGGDGELVHYRSFLTDISARKRVEEALLESERRFRSLFESMTEGVALHELVYEDGRAVDYRILDVNPAFETQTGLVAREAKGRLAGELYGTGEAPYLAEYAEVAESGRPYSFETYFASMERHFRITAITPGPGRFATVFEDVTERKSADAERQRLLEESQAQAEELAAQAEELQAQNEELTNQGEELRSQAAGLTEQARLAEALNAINRLIHSTLSLDQIMQRAIDEGARTLQVEVGTIELRTAGGWLVRYQHGLEVPEADAFLRDELAPNARRAEATREPFAIADLRHGTADVGYVATHRLRSVLAAPLIAAEKVSGCLLFYGRTVRRFDSAEIDFARKLAATVSLALENSRQREALEQTATLRYARSLIEASLDPLVTISAEGLITDVNAATEQATGHSRSELIGTRFPDYFTEPERAGAGYRQVFATGAVRDYHLVIRHRDGRLTEVSYNASLYRNEAGEVLGVFAAARDVTDRNRAQADASESARLYQAERDVALTLQQNFIHPLPELAGWEFAVASEPASAATLVGGDFHDVFDAPPNLAVLIGDVEGKGKGIAAAGLTETVRSAARALALSAAAPPHVLARLNDLLLHDQSQLVTALYVVLSHRPACSSPPRRAIRGRCCCTKTAA